MRIIQTPDGPVCRFKYQIVRPSMEHVESLEQCARGDIHLRSAPDEASAPVVVDVHPETLPQEIYRRAIVTAREVLERLFTARTRMRARNSGEADLEERPTRLEKDQALFTSHFDSAKTEVVADDNRRRTPISSGIILPRPKHVHRDALDMDVSGMAEYLPRLRAEMMAVVKRPFQIVLSGDVSTSATDCRAIVEINPKPFLTGQPEIGFGRALHEAGHLRFSYGSTLIARARDLGGTRLQWVVNVVMDRKDDRANALEFPGFATTLRRRLPYLEEGEHYVSKGEGRWIRVPAKDPISDFYLACKFRRSPQTRIGAQCLRHALRAIRRVMKGESDECLLEASVHILDLLAPVFDARDLEARKDGATNPGLNVRVVHQSHCEQGQEQCTERMHEGWQRLMGTLLKRDRERARNRLQMIMREFREGGSGARISGATPRVHRMPPGTGYEERLQAVKKHLPRFLRALSFVRAPKDTFTMHGLDEGTLDLSVTHRIALGLPGVCCETVDDHATDGEMHLCIDQSTSMRGRPMAFARDIGTLFNEAMLHQKPDLEGRTWGFSDEVYDYGPCAQRSGIAGADVHGSTDEAGALRAIGATLIRSQKSNRVIIMVCDGGPNDPSAVKNVVKQLTRAGIVCIRLLVGVAGSPPIYPIEFPFTTFEEVLDELPNILESVTRSF